MKCYLHVGHEKTATTALQYFLFQNRKVLSDHGYLYSVCGKRDDSDLVVSLYRDDKRDNQTILRGLHSIAERENFNNSVHEAVKRRLKETACSNVLISSEFIQSRLAIEELYDLRLLLDSWGCNEIHVVVYLRDPVATAESLYVTDIMSGGTRASPPGPGEAKYYDNLCNHKRTIERFSEVFGQQRIIPRIYSADEFESGSIYDDFLSCIGCPVQIGSRPTQRMNQGISVLGLEVLRRVNVLLPRFKDQKLNPQRGHVNSYFQRHFKIDDGEKYRMSARLRSRYSEYYADSNQWVAEHLFPDRCRLFDQGMNQPQKKSNYSDRELDAIASLVVSIWKEVDC